MTRAEEIAANAGLRPKGHATGFTALHRAPDPQPGEGTRKLAARAPFGYPVPLADFVALEQLRRNYERATGLRLPNDPLIAAAMALLPPDYEEAAAALERLRRPDDTASTKGGRWRRLVASHAPDEWRHQLADLQVAALAAGEDVPLHLWYRLAVRLLVEAGPRALG